METRSSRVPKPAASRISADGIPDPSMTLSRPALVRSAAPRWLRASALIALLGLAACQARIDVRGHVPDDDSVARLQVGVQGREDVRDLLGSPSSITPFGDETWLYISRKTRSMAFLSPKILEQQVVAIVFDPQGRVADIRQLELADGKVVNHVARVTPSPGKELSFLEQLIGNVGRFNKSSGAYIPGGTAAPPPGTRR